MREYWIGLYSTLIKWKWKGSLDMALGLTILSLLSTILLLLCAVFFFCLCSGKKVGEETAAVEGRKKRKIARYSAA